MCTQQLNPNRLLKLAALLILICSVSPLHALSTDKQQDMEITADSAEMDDMKGISIYRGDVIVVQGTMRITGDIMTVYFDDNGDMELAVMEGKPATYRQLPDDSEVYDEAYALRMEYYTLKDYIILIDEGLVIQEGLRMTGDRIEYDTVSNKASAETKPKEKTETGETSTDGGRVKIIIKKKKEEQ